MKSNNGYKMTEVGVIPEDWKACKFGDVLTGFSSGMTPYRGKPEYYKGDIPWVTSGELNYNIIFDTKEKITKEAVLKTNLNILPVGTFLMAITGLEAEGTRGSCGILGIGATTNQSCMALFPIKDEITTEYLYHFYVLYGNELAFKYCQGTKQQSYTGKIAKLLPINLPPTVKEQKAIAAALSDAAELIQSLEKLIAKKRAIKQGAMQELLKPKEDWTIKKLGEIFNFSGGYSATREQLSTEGYCYLHYGDIHGAKKTYIDVKAEYASIPKLPIELKKISRKSMLSDGDIVFVDASEDDEGTSRHIVIKNTSEIPFISGLHTIVAKSKDNSINNEYKRYCFQSVHIKDQFKFYAVGTKVSGVSKVSIAKIEISFPSTIEEQMRIASTLSDMDAEITVLEAKMEKYKKVKQGMMQNLLTGKIRLV